MIATSAARRGYRDGRRNIVRPWAEVAATGQWAEYRSGWKRGFALYRATRQLGWSLQNG